MDCYTTSKWIMTMANIFKIFWLGVFIFCANNLYAHDANTGQSSLANTNNQTNQVSITTDGQYRYIYSNGIPHTHGQFPNRNNPSAIQAKNYKFRMTLQPRLSGKVTPLWGGMDFGVGIDGIPFDPGTAEFWNNDRNWRYEALSGKINLGFDQNNAHVQPDGAYHYHGLPTELIKNLNPNQHSTIIGYAADGFPIYALYGYSKANNANSGIKELKSSYELRPGTRQSGPGGAYDGTFTADYIYHEGAGDLDQWYPLQIIG